MGAHLYPFREAEVIASAEAEAAPTAAYLEAAGLIPPYARRHADADDVASLARLLLASVMASGLAGSLAAGAAVKRASARLAEANRETREAEMPAGDTRTEAAAAEAEGKPLDYLPRATYPRPDRLAVVTEADRLATILATLAPADMALLAIMRRHGDAWGEGIGRATVGQPNGAAIAARLAGAAVKAGRRTAATAEAARLALAEAAEAAGEIPAWVQAAPLNGADAASHARGLARDTRTEASGLASRVIVTDRHGGLWVLHADRATRTDEAAALFALANVGTVEAHNGGRAYADEETRATLAAPATLRPLRRPAGVGVGMTYGTTGQRAGEGYAELRPATGGRKRKRDGGIGSSMVTGRTGYGNGTAGKAADAGTRPSLADEAARREATMTDAQRARLATLRRRTATAADALKATHDGGLTGPAATAAEAATMPAGRTEAEAEAATAGQAAWGGRA